MAAGQTCDLATNTCLATADIAPTCSACNENADCGPQTATCYQGGCMSYCDTYTACPTGYRCNTINDPGLGQSVRRCVPNTSSGQNCELLLYCLRCTTTDDCNGGRCVNLGAGGRRCAPHCDAAGPSCPQGSSCQNVSGGNLCIPAQCAN